MKKKILLISTLFIGLIVLVGCRRTTGTTVKPTVKTTVSKTTSSNSSSKSEEIKISSLEITGISEDIVEGDTLQLSVKVLPDAAKSRQVTWSSSNTQVATVSQTGLVTALKEGYAVIKVAGDGKEDTYDVYVTKKEELIRDTTPYEVWYEGFELSSSLNEWKLNSDQIPTEVVGQFREAKSDKFTPTELNNALKLTSSFDTDSKTERGFTAVADGWLQIDMMLTEQNGQMSFEVYAGKDDRLFSIHLHQGGKVRYRIDEADGGGYGIRLETDVDWEVNKWITFVVTWNADVEENEFKTYNAYVLMKDENGEYLKQFAKNIPFFYQELSTSPNWMKIRVNKGNDTDKLEGKDAPNNVTGYVDNIILKSLDDMIKDNKFPRVDDTLVQTENIPTVSAKASVVSKVGEKYQFELFGTSISNKQTEGTLYYLIREMSDFTAPTKEEIKALNQKIMISASSTSINGVIEVSNFDMAKTYELFYIVVNEAGETEVKNIREISGATLVYTAAQLHDALEAGAEHIILANDIDATGYDWIPVSKKYEGVLDGANHIINGLNITGDFVLKLNSSNKTIANGKYAGIFATISSATIKNLIISNSKIDAYERSGLIAGNVAGNLKIENVYIAGLTVSMKYDIDYHGALVGRIQSGSVKVTNVAVSDYSVEYDDSYAKDYVVLNGPKFDPSAADEISVDTTKWGAYGGGFVGGVDSGATLNMNDIQIVNSKIQMFDQAAGGLLGRNSGTTNITNAYVNVEVETPKNAGLVAGDVAGTFTITNALLIGKATATAGSGYIQGKNNSATAITPTNVFALVEITPLAEVPAGVTVITIVNDSLYTNLPTFADLWEVKASYKVLKISLAEIKVVKTDKQKVEEVIDWLSNEMPEALEEDFTLPTTDKNSYNTVITWVLDDSEFARIDNNLLIITRPTYTNGSEDIRLVVKIVLNEEEKEFEFNITIPRLPMSDEEKALKIKESLESLVLGKDVTENFVLPITDSFEYASIISWTSKNEAITIDGANAIVIRPDVDKEDILVELKAIIKVNDALEEFKVTFKVLKKSLDPEVVSADINAALDILYTNKEYSDNFTFISKNDTYDIPINWVTLSQQILITNNYATLIRPAYNEQKTAVMVKAIYEVLGVEKTYETTIYILPVLPTNEELVFELRKVVNKVNLDNLTDNVTLPLTTVYGGIISWVSNNHALSSDGKVTRPNYKTSDSTGDVIATIFVNSESVGEQIILSSKVLMKEPIYISTLAELQAIESGTKEYYILENDIDGEGSTFNAIAKFNGTLDGANHKIFNLKINQALIADTNTNVEIAVKNLIFDNIELIQIDAERAAIIFGKTQGNVTIENVVVTNSLIKIRYAQDYIAALVGRSTSGSINIKNVYVDFMMEIATPAEGETINVAGCGYNGGLIAGLSSGVTANISDAEVYVTVLSPDQVAGGIIGRMQGNAMLENVIVKTTAESRKMIGGVFGDVTGKATLTNVVVTGELTSTNETTVGGVSGSGSANITMSKVHQYNVTFILPETKTPIGVNGIEITRASLFEESWWTLNFVNENDLWIFDTESMFYALKIYELGVRPAVNEDEMILVFDNWLKAQFKDEVTEDFDLVSLFPYRDIVVTFTVESGGAISIDSNKVFVYRPKFGSGDELVKIKATYEIAGQPNEKIFEFKVLEFQPDYSSQLAYAKEYVKNLFNNQDLLALVANLTLPLSDDNNYSIITWSSTNTALSNTGIVTRPLATQNDEEGKLIAIITVSTFNPEVVEFDVKVLKEEAATVISTKEELANFINNGGTGNYILANDIDMTDVTLTGSTKIFEGVFDGNGYTISNISAVATANKMGVFFKTLSGTFKNVNFMNCSYTAGGTGEGASFVTYLVTGGAVIENISFTNVKVINTGSAGYNALVFGDFSTASELPITIKGISINNTEAYNVSGIKYIAAIAGRMNAAGTLNVSNVYINSEILSPVSDSNSQAIAFVLSIINAADITVNIDNVVVTGKATGYKNVGAFVGTGKSGSTINITNSVVMDTTIIGAVSQKAGVLVGNINSSIVNVTNVYSANVTTEGASFNNTIGTVIEKVNMTDTWFLNSGLSTSVWEFDKENIKFTLK